MKSCVHCGHAVSCGDRHSRLDCPPRFKGAQANRRRRRHLAKRRARREHIYVPDRGKAVAGTGVPKGE